MNKQYSLDELEIHVTDLDENMPPVAAIRVCENENDETLKFLSFNLPNLGKEEMHNFFNSFEMYVESYCLKSPHEALKDTDIDFNHVYNSFLKPMMDSMKRYCDMNNLELTMFNNPSRIEAGNRVILFVAFLKSLGVVGTPKFVFDFEPKKE